MMIEIPKPEMYAMACEDCGAVAFSLFQSQDPADSWGWDTLCRGCGKRGWLKVETTTTTERTFVQFMDYPAKANS